MSIFPKTEELQIQTAEQTAEFNFGKSFLFDFNKGDFVLKDGKLTVTDEIAALKVWIEKILRTKRDEYQIYEGTQYGSRFDDLLVSSSYPVAFIESELRREIEDALIQNPKIVCISDFTVERTSSNVTASFTVVLVSGLSFDKAVSFDV